MVHNGGLLTDIRNVPIPCDRVEVTPGSNEISVSADFPQRLATASNAARVVVFGYPVLIAGGSVIFGATTHAVIFGCALGVVFEAMFWHAQRTHVIREVVATGPAELSIERFFSRGRICRLGTSSVLTRSARLRSGIDLLLVSEDGSRQFLTISSAADKLQSLRAFCERVPGMSVD